MPQLGWKTPRLDWVQWGSTDMGGQTVSPSREVSFETVSLPKAGYGFNAITATDAKSSSSAPSSQPVPRSPLPACIPLHHARQGVSGQRTSYATFHMAVNGIPTETSACAPIKGWHPLLVQVCNGRSGGWTYWKGHHHPNVSCQHRYRKTGHCRMLANKIGD